MKRLNGIKESLTNQSLSFEEIHLFHECSPEVDIHLGKQKIGTYLYAAAEWNTLKEVVFLAKKLGYSSEEAQFIGVGEKEKRVFCCRCHFISNLRSPLHTGDQMSCSACGMKLELSDHYSPIKEAYLGYVAHIE